MRGTGSRLELSSGAHLSQESALPWLGSTEFFRRRINDKSTATAYPANPAREQSGMGGPAIATIPMD